MLRAGVRRLVLAGSLAAVGPSTPDRPHVETDPFAPEEWYGESKAEAERIALGTAGLEVTVARPPRILGPGDRENLVFFRLVKRGIRLEIEGGPRPLSVVDVDDVVELLLLLATRPEAVGRGVLRARARIRRRSRRSRPWGPRCSGCGRGRSGSRPGGCGRWRRWRTGSAG